MKNSLPSETLLQYVSSIPQKGKLCGINLPATALHLADLLKRNPAKKHLIVVPTLSQAENLYKDITAYGYHKLVLLPFWGTRAYNALSPHASIFATRTIALNTFADTTSSLILPIRSFLYPVPNKTIASTLSWIMLCKKNIQPQYITQKLLTWGYTRVAHVRFQGEFALRGEVIDIYSYGNDLPDRIVMEFDIIKEIKEFDPSTQLSLQEKNSTCIRCSREFPLSSAPEDFPQNWKDMIKAKSPGAEYVFPCIHEACRISDYLNKDDRILLYDPTIIKEEERRMHYEFQQAYVESVLNDNLPKAEKILYHLEDMPQANLVLYPEEIEHIPKIHSQLADHFAGNIQLCQKKLQELTTQGYHVYITTDSSIQVNRLKHILHIDNILHIQLSSGFMLPQKKLAVFTSQDVFGDRTHSSATSSILHKTRQLSFLTELSKGDFVVHINHGIASFKGLKRMKVGGGERDYIELEYAQKESLFVPIEQMNLIQRYIGSEHPPLDHLGSSSWQQKKKRVRKNIQELTYKLLRLYAHRELTHGYAFNTDTEWQHQFEDLFPFEETDDQLKSIEEIKKDMESSTPMNRLLCGDVGFGKTEVALRAAFKAVMDGRQVAFLAPTTILVEQHYQHILERMKDFPIQIEKLSRFLSSKEQKKIITEIKQGKIDIVVGTHKLLQKEIHFKLLGLLIIDEEQRFGVSAKERLKELKQNVDCLLLSATPIPRTLHMSLLKIYNMSVLQQAPRNRKPIRTVVRAFQEEEVARAIRNELTRNGQIYYLHNRVISLRYIQKFIEHLVPEATCDVVHGKMNTKEIEDIMRRFVHGAFNILISTTIIENGLDIPNVNTIIIDRADYYGISQLYQLRGRVGRSDRVAYAYLLYPDKNYLSEIAQRRLEVIRDHTELGSGFQVAIRDMELRGVGNLLGKEQSGNASAIGLELYLQLLEKEIHIQQHTTEEANKEVYLELEYRGFIPDSYIMEPTVKMELYKNIASISCDNELSDLLQQTVDRFGPIPSELNNLFLISQLRILCQKLGVITVREKNKTAFITFSATTLHIQPVKIVSLLQNEEYKVHMQIDKNMMIVEYTQNMSLKERHQHILTVLKKLE